MSRTKKAVKKNEVTPVDETPQLPVEMPDLSELAGAGQMTNVNYLAIPYLSIIGLQSGYCLEESDKYVEGARPGMLIETLNKNLYKGKEGCIVVPVLTKVVVTKIDGSITDSRVRIGKLNELEGEKIKATCKQDGYQFYDEDGNYYEDELEYYVIIVVGKERYKACISMNGTRIKKGKVWNSLAAQHKIDGGRPAPIFVRKYSVKTILEQNDSNKWYNFEIEDAGPVLEPDLMREAIAFFKVVDGGQYEVTGEDDVPASSERASDI